MCRGVVMTCLPFELLIIISAFQFQKKSLMNWLYM
nr:MAG TPA: hypothetical protein [Caudoviricetes sp.]